jgi:UDP-glucose 4-epimerase
MLRICVTGGYGFLGSALMKRLRIAGHIVNGLDNGWRQGDRYWDCDVRNQTAVEAAVRGAEVVIHLACINGTENFYRIPYEVLEVSTLGMVNVLRACDKHDVKTVFVASSAEACQSDKVPTDEAASLMVPDPLNPRFSYGGGKIISELLALNWGLAQAGRRVVVFRPHNLYGPGDGGSGHVIPSLLEKIDRRGENEPLTIQGSGQETRSFLYIDDCVEGIMTLLERGEHRNIYNLGTMTEVSVGLLARKLLDLRGMAHVEIKTGDLLPGSILRRCPDTTKMHGLGWWPRTDLAVGLANTVKWWTEGRK